MVVARMGLVVVLGLAILITGGCEDTTPSPEARLAVEQSVETYLHALTRAYSNLSVEPIEDLATGSEVQGVRKMLRGLAGTGDRVEARLLSVDFTRVDIFREVNATVATTEVWDVTQFERLQRPGKGTKSHIYSGFHHSTAPDRRGVEDNGPAGHRPGGRAPLVNGRGGVRRPGGPMSRQPVIVIVGRPNVGKSTLFNRLTRSRRALVHDLPGVTRDRIVGEAPWRGGTATIIDTGGLIFEDSDTFVPLIRTQADVAAPGG